jgi:hypothetical protein
VARRALCSILCLQSKLKFAGTWQLRKGCLRSNTQVKEVIRADHGAVSGAYILTRTTQDGPLNPISMALRFGPASFSLVQILLGIRVEFLPGYSSCVSPRCRAKLLAEHLDCFRS